MSSVCLTTVIGAPVERCFDLCRSVDLHVDSYSHAHERAVGGVTSGLVDLGDEVHFRMRELGFPYGISVRIAALDRPHHFRDEQIEGILTRANHDHHFEAVEGGTRMVDTFTYNPPLGPIGRGLDALFLRRHITRTLSRKNANLARVAEGSAWADYLA